MSTRTNFKQIQGPHSHSSFYKEYERLEQLIKDKTGVVCAVMIKPEQINIRTKDYAEYLLAKSAISGQVSKPIVRDL